MTEESIGEGKGLGSSWRASQRELPASRLKALPEREQYEKQLFATTGLKPGSTIYVRRLVDMHDNSDSLWRDCDEETEIASLESSEEIGIWRAQLSETPMVWEHYQAGLEDSTALPSQETQKPRKWAVDSEGRFVWLLKYETKSSYAEQESPIVFESHRSLLHLAAEGRSPVALRYFSYLPEEQELSELDESENSVTLGALLKEIEGNDMAESEHGLFNVESQLLEASHNLDHTLKVEVALRCREFTERCVEFLKQCIEEKGESHVITAEEVRSFFSQIKRESKFC